MIHVAGPTLIFWAVSAGMGFAVLAVVIILLNLLLKSVRALDTRVDHVWSAAAGVHAHTAIAGPQLNAAERQLAGAVAALRPSAPAPRPAPQFQPMGPAPQAPAQPAAPRLRPAPSQTGPALPRFARPTGPQRRPADPRFPTSLPPVPPAPAWEPGQPRRSR